MGIDVGVKREFSIGFRRRHPEFDERQVQCKYIELTYGEDLAAGFRRYPEGKSNEPRQRDSYNAFACVRSISHAYCMQRVPVTFLLS